MSARPLVASVLQAEVVTHDLGRSYVELQRLSRFAPAQPPLAHDAQDHRPVVRSMRGTFMATRARAPPLSQA